jgi:hypothetical protein
MGATTTDSAITAAAGYIGRNFRVLPLNGKVPYGGSNGSLSASRDPARLPAWPSGCNVGIATGRGLVVLDVDHPDGLDTLHELEAKHAPLPTTVKVITGMGGEHYYFSGRGIANSAGRLGAGLDIRGEGGYVVAPPSVHPSTGRAYQWECAPGDMPIAPLPEWLRARLRAADRTPVVPAPEWIGIVRDGLPEGERNEGMCRLVGHLVAKGVDEGLVLELALLINLRNRPPLTDREVRRTVESVVRLERGKPAPRRMWGS